MNAIRIQRSDEPKSKVRLSSIRTDGGTQARANVSDTVVDDYAAAIADGATFPKMVVFYDGSEHWLADGFHRHKAYLKAGVTVVDADVRQGTRREAILFSVGANLTHGYRRTNDDKRRAVLTLLNDEEWGAWPQTKVAVACGVSQQYVSKVATELGEGLSYNSGKMRTVERGGSTFTMDTSSIGTATISRPSDVPDENDFVTTDIIDTEEEITAEDLENDPGFQRAVEAMNNAKALMDDVAAMPAAEPMTPEREARLKRAFGTPEVRSDLMAILNAVKLLDRLPEPMAMAEVVPPTMTHAVDVLAILKLSNWFERFARAFEQRREGASA